jgi:predicted HD superfamily hydrolase involved in NAD metabolism
MFKDSDKNAVLLKSIYDYISKKLDKERFIHSVNVSKEAINLAKIYKVSVFKAQIAALLHDCSKSGYAKEQVLFFKGRKKFGYFDIIAKNAPQLLHSFSGAIIAKERFKIKDKDILNAISNHTLGRENMSVLEKIIFISDCVSADRKCAKAKKIKKTALKDLDEAFRGALRNKIQYCLDTNKWICHKSLKVWNHYAKNK